MPYDGTNFDIGKKQKTGDGNTKPTTFPENPVPHPTTRSRYLEELDRKRGINAVDVERKKNDQNNGKEFNRRRDLSREERIRQINARGKGKLLNRVAKNRKLQRIGKIKKGGKSSLLTKLAAKGVYRLIMYAAPWIWLIQIGFFILTLMMGSFAEKTILEAGKDVVTAAFFGPAAVGVEVAKGTVVVAKEALKEFNEEFDPAASLTLALFTVTVFIGYLSLMIIWIMYKVTPVGIHPTGGKDHGGMKWLILLMAILLHTFPFTNAVPWWWFWAWYIKQHPA